jgi:hypothetical protein
MRARWSALIAVGWAAATLGLTAPGALASFSTLPSSTWVTDGHVNAVAVADNHIFLGGAFTQVGPNTGDGVAFDTSTLTRDESFAAFNGPVDVTVPDGAGGFYVGGSFTEVGGQSHPGVVHLLPGGAVDPSFTAAVSGTGGSPAVQALALADGKLYIGGNFDHVDGEAHSDLGAVSATTGAVDSAFNVNPGGQVDALLATGGSDPRVYAGGSWSQINGVTEDQGLISIDPSTDGLDPSFAGSVSGGWVYALATDGTSLYLGGSFGGIDGQPRSNLGAVALTDGSVKPLAPTVGGWVHSLAVIGQRLFVGGGFNGSPSSNLVAYDLSSSNANPLDPAFTPNPNGEVDSLTAVGTTLYVGGQFSQIDGVPRQRLAALNGDSTSTGYGSLGSFNPLPDGTVLALGSSGNRLFVGGSFGIVGGLHRTDVAALNLSDGTADPSFTANASPVGAYTGAPQVDALAVAGTTLYIGGRFGGINSQSKPYLAAVDTSDGTVVAGFSPDPDNEVWSLAASSSRLYAAGVFENIGGSAQPWVDSLALDTGTSDPAFAAHSNGQIFAVALGDGNLYIDGDFSAVGGVGRPGLAAVDAGTGALDTAFSPPAGTGQGSGLAAAPGLAYASTGGIGSPPQYGATALDASSGALSGFNAGFSTYADVHTMVVAGSQLVLGGNFQTVGGHAHANLVAVDATTGADDTTFDPSTGNGQINDGTANGEVDALAYDGTNLYVGGQFTVVDGLPQEHFAQFGTGAAAGAPTDTAPPSISGTAQEDQTLTAAPGAWTGSPATYTYQWRDCDPSGFSCTDIPGATSPAYTASAADVGSTLVVRVTAANAAGSSQPAVSEHTAVVSTANSVNAPTATTGTSGAVDSSSAVVDATVDGAGEATTYWFDYGTAVSALTSSTPRYSLGSAPGAQAVSGQLTALSPSTTYYYEVVAQNASGIATGAPQQLTTAAGSAGGGPPAPTLTVTTGGVHDLTATTATLLGIVTPGGADASYWFQYGAGTSYGAVTAPLDAGSQGTFSAAGDVSGLQPATLYHYRLVAQPGGGSPVYGSDQTFTTPPLPAPTNTQPPLIAGTAQAGQTLTALTGSWTGAPSSYTFDWLACDATGAGCAAITSAGTGPHFDVTPDLVGRTIRVLVEATNQGGTSNPAQSDPTDPVTAAASNGGGGSGSGGSGGSGNSASGSGTNGSGSSSAAAPSSTASSPIWAGDTFTVNYVASDPNSSVSRVELWVKGPSDEYFEKVQTDSSPPANGQGGFTYTATEGDGAYAFYTRAADGAANTEPEKSSPDSITHVDTRPPVSSASVPSPYTRSSSITVGYTDSGHPGGPAVTAIELWVKLPGHSGYTLASSQASPGASGDFTYPMLSDGTYSFYTRATDAAGDSEPGKASADATVIRDTVAPTVTITTPAPGATYGQRTSTAADYTCSDPGGSGIASCTGSSLAGHAFDTATPGPHTFSVTATDNAGNVTTRAVTYQVRRSTLKAPILTSASYPSNVGLVVLAWQPLPGVTAYRVLRATQEGGPYTAIATIPYLVPQTTGLPQGVVVPYAPARTYKDDNVLPAMTYYYVLQGLYRQKGSRTPIASSDSDEKWVTTPTNPLSPPPAAPASPCHATSSGGGSSTPRFVMTLGAEQLDLNPGSFTLSRTHTPAGDGARGFGHTARDIVLSVPGCAPGAHRLEEWARKNRTHSFTLTVTQGDLLVTYAFTRASVIDIVKDCPTRTTGSSAASGGARGASGVDASTCQTTYSILYGTIQTTRKRLPAGSEHLGASHGAARVPVSCRSSSPCSGIAWLALEATGVVGAGPVDIPGRWASRRILGSVQFRIPPDSGGTLRIRLDALGRRLLANAPHHQLSVLLLVHLNGTPRSSDLQQRITLGGD